jgi:putative membrane protein
MPDSPADLHSVNFEQKAIRPTHEESWMSRNIGKGLVAGLVGGLIGTVVMTEFQNGWSAASKALKNGNTEQNKPTNQQQNEESEDATMKAAGKIASIAGRQLSHAQRKKLGPVVHYSFGTLQGALYGSIAEMAGNSEGLLPGLVFGSALFLAVDEVAVPALGLSGKPTEYPISSHLYGLAAHLVYGVSTEIARRGFRAVLQ